MLLTKNGRVRYAIMDIREYEKIRATIRLMCELARGQHSEEERGWLTIDEVEANLGIADR